MNVYYNYYHILLLSVVMGNAVCMEQSIIKKEQSICPLYVDAVHLGNLNLLDRCIKDKTFDPTYHDNKEGSLLQRAVRGGRENIVERLLQNSYIRENINKVVCGAPVLFIAAQHGFCGIAQRLLDTGLIDMSLQYYKGHFNRTSPFCIAVKKRHGDMVELLAKQDGIDINVQSKRGTTALHFAVEENYVDMIPILLGLPNIKIEIENAFGKTPLKIARERGYSIIEALLNDWLEKNKAQDDK